jgi:hypothetical protein
MKSSSAGHSRRLHTMAVVQIRTTRGPRWYCCQAIVGRSASGHPQTRRELTIRKPQREERFRRRTPKEDERARERKGRVPVCIDLGLREKLEHERVQALITCGIRTLHKHRQTKFALVRLCLKVESSADAPPPQQQSVPAYPSAAGYYPQYNRPGEPYGLTANMHHRLPLHHPPRVGVHLSEQESTYLRSVSASATSAASTTRLLFTK